MLAQKMLFLATKCFRPKRGESEFSAVSGDVKTVLHAFAGFRLCVTLIVTQLHK